jgi:DNA-binding NarL/FixJ family response regulator
MPERYRICIAEDHAILRDGLRAILATVPEFEVVCEVGDGREAVQAAANHAPDLMLLDLTMPRVNGMEALREIKRSSPTVKVVVLTVHRTEEYVFEALRCGADGYILKDATSDELLLGLKSVLRGYRYLSPQVSPKVIDGYLGNRDPKGLESPFESLTQREREVLKLIAEGNRNREIADFLCLAEKTVEKHRASLMRKLDLGNPQALTAYAIEKGLVRR